jgi:phosphatidylinositol alpha-1,6-mannosyltransferase
MLITDGFGSAGGIGQYNRDLMTALSESDCVTSVLALPRFGIPDAPIADKVTQLRPLQSAAAFSARTLQLAVSRRFDAVFCGHLYMAPLAATVSRMINRPLWLQVHGIEAWPRPGIALRKATAMAQLVTSVSRYTRRQLLQWSDIAPERVRVLPNTVAAGFQPRLRSADLAARLGLTGRRIVLTVGRMSSSERYKGHERVMAALPQVAQRHPNIAYLVVGGGDDVPRLSALAHSSGNGSRVVFTGAVPEDELADYFALADVFAMPSTGEGFGIVFLQAAASGLPVIGSNSDGSCDALADGRIGPTLDPDDPAALVSAIVDSIEGRVETAATRVQSFSFRNYACHVDELIQQLT